MERIPVESSSIKSVGYDDNRKILEVEFNNGGIYHFFNFPRSQFEAFLDAESKGRFFNSKIKTSGYLYRKLN